MGVLDFSTPFFCDLNLIAGFMVKEYSHEKTVKRKKIIKNFFSVVALLKQVPESMEPIVLSGDAFLVVADYSSEQDADAAMAKIIYLLNHPETDDGKHSYYGDFTEGVLE
jgi:hypothetical protein